jgi:Xaa-Pro aminopeptidase
MVDRRPGRQAALRARLADRQVDAMVVTGTANIRWLTGFTGSAGMLLIEPTKCYLVTDFRYAVQAPQEVGAGAEVVIERSSVWGRIGELLARGGWGRVGYQGTELSARDAARLGELVAGTLVDVGEALELLREVKDADEVAAIREAGVVAGAALAEVLPTVRLGEREIDVAARLEAALRVRGSEWHPFETIVASGPRSALPHARTSERRLARGDLLLIDFGAKVRGYCSDITRTVTLGGADERQRAVYQLVYAAQRAAREGIRAGMTGGEADALAREPITARGFGEAFGHSLGHGVGLEVHEGPRLAVGVRRPLPVGAVVTVEPGIYLPGWGGVRLEDDVWLSPDGAELVTDGHTELVELDL